MDLLNPYCLGIVVYVATDTSLDPELPCLYVLSGGQGPIESVSLVSEHITECHTHNVK